MIPRAGDFGDSPNCVHVLSNSVTANTGATLLNDRTADYGDIMFSDVGKLRTMGGMCSYVGDAETEYCELVEVVQQKRGASDTEGGELVIMLTTPKVYYSYGEVSRIVIKTKLDPGSPNNEELFINGNTDANKKGIIVMKSNQISDDLWHWDTGQGGLHAKIFYKWNGGVIA
jgi:hypothetical protein